MFLKTRLIGLIVVIHNRPTHCMKFTLQINVFIIKSHMTGNCNSHL